MNDVMPRNGAQAAAAGARGAQTPGDQTSAARASAAGPLAFGREASHGGPRWKGAFITGGSTGIGLELARRLVAQGTRVAICARSEVNLKQAAASIGKDIVAFTADLSDPERAYDAVDQARSALGAMDLVIANAGIGGNRHASAIRSSDVIPILQINVLGACATLAAAIPHLLSSGGGNLVGISSIAGYRGLPGAAAYSASKAALSVFLESIRVDLRGSNITVTDIRPGFVDTPLTARNRFYMPFMVPVEKAGAQILHAIEQGRRVYTFPWPMALAIRLIRLAPAWLYDAAGSRVRVEKLPPEPG